MRCLVPQPDPMVGYAVTVTIDSTSGETSLDGLAAVQRMCDAIAEQPGPAVVVLHEVGPAPSQ